MAEEKEQSQRKISPDVRRMVDHRDSVQKSERPIARPTGRPPKGGSRIQRPQQTAKPDSDKKTPK